MTDTSSPLTRPEASSPIEALRAALTAAEEAGDLAAQNLALGRLGRALMAEDDALPALACFEKGVKIAQQLDDKASGARHLANEGVALAQIGNYPLALRAFRKALGFARELSHEPLEYDLLLRLAELERARKSPESATGHLDEALVIAERHGGGARSMRVHVVYGQVEWDLDEIDGAIGHFETALALAREVGDLGEQSNCLNTLGGFARARRDPAGAAGLFEQALALDPSAHTPQRRMALLAKLGDLRFSQGDINESLRLFTEALELARALGDRESEARLLGSLGIIAAELDQQERSLELANAAVALARELGDPRLHGEQLLFQSMALADLGQIEPALTACDAAIIFFEGLEASSLVQKAYELRERLTGDESA